MLAYGILYLVSFYLLYILDDEYLLYAFQVNNYICSASVEIFFVYRALFAIIFSVIHDRNPLDLFHLFAEAFEFFDHKILSLFIQFFSLFVPLDTSWIEKKVGKNWSLSLAFWHMVYYIYIRCIWMSYFLSSSLSLRKFSFRFWFFLLYNTLNEKSKRIIKGCGVIRRFAQFHLNGFSYTSHLLQVAASTKHIWYICSFAYENFFKRVDFSFSHHLQKEFFFLPRPQRLLFICWKKGSEKKFGKTRWSAFGRGSRI